MGPLVRVFHVEKHASITVYHSMPRSLTALFIRDDVDFVAFCPEVDVASQGSSVEDAKKNLREAVELFFECASPQEIEARLSSKSFISSLEVNVA